MKSLAFGQKGVTYFWQSLDAILEDISVPKKFFNAKNVNQKTSIFHCFKIYGNSTNRT